MAKTPLKVRLARWLLGAPSVRLYAGARPSRMSASFGASGATSADAELAASLAALRTRSRQMLRDSNYARRARAIVQNNVVGQGIGFQSQVTNARGELSKKISDAIEREWRLWSRAENCHTAGVLHFADLERLALGQVFEAGEIFIRKHVRPGARVPLVLELIEPERLADETTNRPLPGAQGAVRMGVEVDGFQRPIAYWIRSHPGDRRWGEPGRVEDKVIRVPAEEIFHLRIVDRWPQTRGAPWLYTALRKLDDMNEYSGAELAAARASSFYFATIQSPDDGGGLANDSTPDGAGGAQQTLEIEPGLIQQLLPGEELKFHAPNRPNSMLDPFIRAMLREVAAGIGVSYESLSRDYSQSNYSSSRLALLDDRDLWRVLQQWWIRSFREPLFRDWLRLAVSSGAIPEVGIESYALDPMRFEEVIWKPRGWQWVDPVKEIAAYKEAVRAGFTTITDVISQTAGGQDIEDVLTTRERELKLLDEYGIDVDTTVEEEQAPPAPPPTDTPPPGTEVDAEDEDEGEEDQPSRGGSRVLRFGGTIK